MNLDETPAEIAARSQMASALQQLGHSLVGHRVDIELAEEVTAIARDLTANVAARPARDRTREMASNPRFAGILSGRSSEGIGLDGQPMVGHAVEFECARARRQLLDARRQVDAPQVRLAGLDEDGRGAARAGQVEADFRSGVGPDALGDVDVAARIE